MRSFPQICLASLALLVGATVPMFGGEPTPVAADWFVVDDAAYPALPVPEGRGGAFIGTHQGAVIVAGGSTFDKPGWEGGTKQYHRDIFVLVRQPDGTSQWQGGFTLPQPRAHGAMVSTPQGVICLGGESDEGYHDDIVLLQWNPVAQEVVVRQFDVHLPHPLKDAAATYLADVAQAHVYIAGGISAEGESQILFARVPLNALLTADADVADAWETLPDLPGPSRFGAALVTQFDGYENNVYLMGGRTTQDNAYLADVHRYEPRQRRWHRMSDMPRPALLAPHVAIGQAHILVVAGSDGRNVDRWQQMQHDYQFGPEIFVYHTITDTWVQAGELGVGVVGSAIVPFDGQYLIPGGEVRPTIRTPMIQTLQLKTTISRFGWLDYTALGLYLMSLVVIGIYCLRRGKNTHDFFLAGKRIPWWAAGLSIMATQVSSIGFMATPAKTFATDWLYIAGIVTWFIVVPIVTIIFIPFFCKLNVTSAYEYLEVRFNVIVRLLAALLFSLLQLGRVAIVLFLPALALSAVIGIDITLCILIMGVLATIYTAAGGMEAVVWTDVLQAIALLGGAMLCIGLVMFGIDGGPSQFFEIAWADSKFRMVDARWDYTAPVLWVILVGNVATRLANLTSDQSIVQRYLSTADARQAKRALWTDVAVSIPWAILIFMLGTALYVYYKLHPEQVLPDMDINGVVPLFISHQVPAGLSGLIVAAIFAASMSSFDSAVHSVTTVATTDFYQRFRRNANPKATLWLARGVVMGLGALGTISALAIASSDVKSIWDLFIEILGLGIGILAGLFMLGAFTRRGNGPGAIVGIVAGCIILYVVKYHTSINIWLYPAIGITSCWGIGYLASMPFAKKATASEQANPSGG